MDDKGLQNALDIDRLSKNILDWGKCLGFQQLGFTDTDLSEHEGHLDRWLENGFEGEMSYMSKHGSRRSRPDELIPGTVGSCLCFVLT